MILGASNVRMSLAVLLDEALRRVERPAEVFLACGHGRSYLAEAALPHRVLPGIVDSRLWNDAGLSVEAGHGHAGSRHAGNVSSPGRDDRPPLAVLADIGNDLMYGRSPAMIEAGIGRCLTRIVAAGGRAVVVGVPLCNIDERAVWRYWVLRRVFFPKLSLTIGDFLVAATELDERLRAVTERHHATYVTPTAAWYGLDPIHFLPGRRRAVWRAVVSYLFPGPAAETAVPQPPYPSMPASRRPGLTTWEAATIKFRPAQSRRVFGRTRTSAQPAMILADGTRVSLY